MLVLGKSEEEDSETLRTLFANEVTEKIANYKDWMTGNNQLKELEKLKSDGHFVSEVVDL